MCDQSSFVIVLVLLFIHIFAVLICNIRIEDRYQKKTDNDDDIDNNNFNEK